MKTISNGIETMEVTSGAFENYFKKQGFYEVGKEEIEPAEIEELEDEELTDEELVNNSNNDNLNDDTEKNMKEELEEKPLSNWTKEEVKEYAEIVGLDLKGTKNIKEAKKIIKELMLG